MAHVEPQTGGPSAGNERDAGERESGGGVSLKRKKVPSIGDAVAVPSEQRSYAAVVKDQEPPAAPSSSALGNLSTANGKRLKLDIKDHGGAAIITPAPLHGDKPTVVRSKPPIPPKPDANRTPSGKGVATGARPKKQQVTESHNAHTVQKLLAQNEQMRLELADLRSSLAAERNAVRVLRAQNEADLRKTKAECKKLQEALQHHKRNVAAQTVPPAPAGGLPAKRTREHELLPGLAGQEVARGGHQPLEVLKLNQELSALRETNRFLEEKYQISSEAERRKAADIRVQRDLYELRLTQLSKSAKNEIQRLLEELKSKERSIAQLKKELQTSQQTAVAGGCRKERKAAAAKNSAQQSHEMRKLRETESCSGTISKCNSNHSIQSVDADYEQLETRETLELTIVTATTTTEVVSTAAGSDCHPNRRSNGRPEPADLLGIATTTYGNDEAPQPALPYELPQRTMEAHSDDNDPISSNSSSSSSSSASSVETKRLSVLAKQSTPPIDCRDPSLGSDTDSALSSMSPQPSSFEPAEPVTDPWQVCGGGDGGGDATVKLTRIKTQLDEMQHRYGSLGQDYAAAKDQIDRLERELLKATKETHELREQNELLEFRIIELEESHDKWSLGSNSSPTVGGSTTKDGWTDTEKEHDELTMLSERSDSGVTSPNSHHHLEDQPSGVPSPCDLSLLDQIPTDDVRKRLVAMTKRPCYDDEDKLCLLQILSLLNNLEALSQDHEIAGDDLSLVEMPSPKYNYALPESSTPPKALQSYRAGAGKIVATVQPFHSTDRSTPAEPAVATTATPSKSMSIASIAETFGGMKKTTRWNTAAALQESGVFVDEPLGAYSAATTQTELEDFPCPEKTNAELCAEIEKLNKFRQKIEECKGSAAKVGPQLPAATGDETCDRRRLQFYVERSAALENKLKVYESSGDQQLRLLAERLDRELHLEGWVKQLSERVHHLELDNGRLEEERCELEEVENDTRLRLQRLEEDLEVMGQRNVELELSRGSYQTKYQDAKGTIVGLEELVQKYEEKIFLLEENEHELRDRIEVINMFIPLLLLYNSWQIHEQLKALQQKQREDLHQQQAQQRLRQPRPRSPPAIQCIPLERIEYYEGTGTEGHAGDELQQRLSELMKREKELTQNIAELNRAYNETLENADNLWAQMEREYKEKIGRCEQEEATLKAKIAQLEERLGKDAEYASERIAHLEEAENGLKARISRLGKENKELGAKHGGLLEEYGALKDDYTQLQCYLRGPAAEALEREKKRVLALEDELAHTGQMLRDSEDSHRAEVGTLRGRLLAATKELNHIEVTNSELREEVETLEARIRELMTFRSRDEEKIKHLTEELESKQSQIVALQHTRSTAGGGGNSGFRSVAAAAAAGRSLAQELGSYTPRHASYYEPLGGRRFPDSDGSSSEENKASKFSSQRPLAAAAAFETKEVKSLAETIILNAESRGGVKTPKKSFVEETDN
ncbi:uncharacterized protein LOC128275344 isoform X2 [Anopheles cruzii]|uniref:uncharacterized protein LOC128275344 isoform X2 n=1 Tax=Anopheles cruzii TaxID=68878 RepID=UPI0022EC4EA3|nr:uncharacterized protein LOC128275344 isoform X2 [Anopheles cruzii]